MRALEVWLHGTQVGLLERFPDQNYRFSFAEGWLDHPARPTLGQLFEDRRPLPFETSGLPCWFGHLLPQPSGPLYRLLQAEARSRGFVDEDGDPDNYLLLAMVGADLPGAVELRPGSPKWPSPPRRDPGRAFVGDTSSPGLYPSLAGLQLKLSVDGSIERGFTVPVSGRSGRWIAKFDRDARSIPRIEFATTCWARASGVRTSDVLLRPVAELRGLPPGFPGEGEVFLSRRFDRDGDTRVHMEDFAQILDRPMPDRFFLGTSEEIFVILAALCPMEDVEQAIQRVAFAGLSREWDGHLKNWSVTYPDRRSPRLSPAYDLIAGVYEHVSATADDRLVLPVGGSRRFEALCRASFDALGVLTGLGARAGALAEEAGRAIRAAWRATRDELPWTDRERQVIERHLERVPLGASTS